MKYLCLFSLLVGCVRFTNPVPWKQPDNEVVVCSNTVCCYSTSDNTKVCVDSNIGANNAPNYYFVIKY